MRHIIPKSIEVFWISLLSSPAYSEQNVFSLTTILQCVCTICTGSWMSVWGPFNWIYKKSVSIKSCQIYPSVPWLQRRKKKALLNVTAIFQRVIFSHVVMFPQIRKITALVSVGMGSLNGNRRVLIFFTMDSCPVCFPDWINYVHGYWAKFISVGNR